MELIKDVFKNKKMIVAGVLVFAILLTGLFLWSSKPKENKIDYRNNVTGLRNWTVEVDTKDVDYLSGVTWNKEYIKSVTVDDKAVDLTKVGNYDLTYIIDVKEKGVKDIKVEKKVKVVSKEEAKEAEEKGEEVATEEGIKNEKSEDADHSTHDHTTSSESKPSESKSSASKKESSNTTKPKSSTNSNTGSGKETSSGTTSNNTKPTHTHSWQPVYTTVHHDAVYSQKWVIDAQAQYGERAICNQCGTDITGMIDAHFKANRSCSGYHSEVREISPEQGHYENVLVSDAYDEQILTGHRCECGARK